MQLLSANGSCYHLKMLYWNWIFSFISHRKQKAFLKRSFTERCIHSFHFCVWVKLCLIFVSAVVLKFAPVIKPYVHGLNFWIIKDLELEKSRSDCVLLWALFASELISAECLVGSRWRRLDVSYLYTSHRGCSPRGLPPLPLSYSPTVNNYHNPWSIITAWTVTLCSSGNPT